jgi:hypothetical protein
MNFHVFTYKKGCEIILHLLVKMALGSFVEAKEITNLQLLDDV